MDNNKARLRRRTMAIGAFFSAVGIAFVSVEGANTAIGIVSLTLGIGLYAASNFFRTKIKREE